MSESASSWQLTEPSAGDPRRQLKMALDGTQVMQQIDLRLTGRRAHVGDAHAGGAHEGAHTLAARPHHNLSIGLVGPYIALL